MLRNDSNEFHNLGALWRVDWAPKRAEARSDSLEAFLSAAMSCRESVGLVCTVSWGKVCVATWDETSRDEGWILSPNLHASGKDPEIWRIITVCMVLARVAYACTPAVGQWQSNPDIMDGVNSAAIPDQAMFSGADRQRLQEIDWWRPNDTIHGRAPWARSTGFLPNSRLHQHDLIVNRFIRYDVSICKRGKVNW